MADVQVKNDVEQIERNAQPAARVTARIIQMILKLLTRLFKQLFNSVYRNHIEGLKAIKMDGKTKEYDKIENLSYEEVIDVLTKCQEHDVPVVAYERKKDVDKQRSLSKMQKMTKTNRELNKLLEKQAKHPKRKSLQKKIDNCRSELAKEAKKNEGYRYNVAFNKSRAGYMADRIVDIKKMRLNVLETMQDDKNNEAVNLIKEHGFDLNIEEIKSFLNEFKDKGDIDVSEFKEDYIVHTIDFDEYTKNYNDLDQLDVEYGLEISKNTTGENEDGIVKIYIFSDDFEEYVKSGYYKTGSIQSVAKNDNTIIGTKDNIKKTTKEFELPKSSMDQYMKMFKGYNYQMYIKDENTIVVSTDLETAKAVREAQKKRDPTQEKIDSIEKKRDKEAYNKLIDVIQEAEKQEEEENTLSDGAAEPQENTVTYAYNAKTYDEQLQEIINNNKDNSYDMNKVIDKMRANNLTPLTVQELNECRSEPQENTVTYAYNAKTYEEQLQEIIKNNKDNSYDMNKVIDKMRANNLTPLTEQELNECKAEKTENTNQESINIVDDFEVSKDGD